MTPEQLVEVTKKSSVEISGELSSFAAGCAKDSRQLCEFALENVLLHEAAAQQLQVAVADLVNDGQELLQGTTQLQLKLEQLRAVAAKAAALRQAVDRDLHLPPALQAAAATTIAATGGAAATGAAGAAAAAGGGGRAAVPAGSKQGSSS